ncbi:MAG: POTRA domain-containing protein [Terriglobia bacterium]
MFSLWLLPPRLAAQQPAPEVSYEGQRVASVDLTAQPAMNLDAVRALILQKAGQPYSSQKIQASIAALKNTGQFGKVATQITAQPNGLGVTFILQPAFYVGLISFPGATKAFSYPRLLQVVNYPTEEPYEPGRAQQAVPALEHFFQQNGRFTAHVQLETKLDRTNQLANLAFHVTLHPPAKFGRVTVIGPPARESRQLERALRSWWAVLKGASLKPGKPYSRKKIEAAFGFLHEELGKQNQLAAQIHLQPVRYNPETNRADLTFQVDPGSKISVRLSGARVWKRTLRKLMPIYEEDSFDQDLVEEGERNLASYFQSKGFFDVKVEPKIQNEPSNISLVYQITKGRRHRVVGLAIQGNKHFSDDDLLALVTIKKARFFSRGRFSNALLDQSIKNLSNYYRQAGFEDVKIRPQVIDREPQVSVTLRINEGPQTMVAALDVAGNKTQPLSKLAPQGLNLKPGKPYSQRLLNQDRDQMMSTYLNLGYADATFKATVRRLKGHPHQVDVTYAIQEGPRAFIQSVLLMGQQQTREAFIARTADLHAGAPLSEGRLLESESRLDELNIFDWASIQPRRPITNQSHEKVLVKVHEAKRNSLSYGIGFEVQPRTGNLPAGTVALPGLPPVGLPNSFRVTQKSFVSPRGSIAYTRRNLRGLGETAAVSALVSRLDQRGTFTYSDPHFRGLNWSSLFSASAERTSENPLFTARLGQASFQLQRPLDRARTKTLLLRYSFQRTTLTNLLIPGLVLPQDRSIRLSTLSATYIHDTRNNPLDAHRGIYQTFDFDINPKIIGSSADFSRFLGQTAFYREVRPWLVWATDVRAGVAKPFSGGEIPLSERFFTGGADSLRGFPTFGAGPQRTVRACIDNNNPSTCVNILVPVGGNELFILNEEGRFPLPIKKGLGGVIFYDGGNVYDHLVINNFFKEYTNNVGFGLRYDTPVGPVRIDIGRNLHPVPGIKATQFFVTLGQAF